MSGFRILCVLVGLLSSAIAHGEEVEDMFPLFRAICLASDGNFDRAEKLAISHGFEADGVAAHMRTYRRTGDAGYPSPVVVFKFPGWEYGDTCEVVGQTRMLSQFLNEMRASNLVEVPKEEMLGSFAGDLEASYFLRPQCIVVAPPPGCSMISAVGDPEVDGVFGGVFRLSITPPGEV
jgi:hypothetical protein